MRPAPWSDAENDLIVADYFAMLQLDTDGRPYYKARHHRDLAPLLLNRSEKSVEYKHQNISAVLKGAGEVWIPGYAPAFNYQMSLEDAVARWLTRNPAWIARIPSPVAAAGMDDAQLLFVRAPPTLSNQPPPQELEQTLRTARKFDAAGRDERNDAVPGRGVGSG